MGYAVILTAAGKASTSGGTFADSLTALSGDNTTVLTANSGNSRVVEAWAMDSAHVAELSWYYPRPEATHDQTYGMRFQIPALLPGGAAVPKAHNLLPGYAYVDVFSGDTPTLNITSTASDAFLLSYLTEYDDVSGIDAKFASPDQLVGLKKSSMAFYNAAAGGTASVYGTARALNADDDRFHGNTWYAILGWTVSTSVHTIGLAGPSWGGQKIGGPAGVQNLETTWYFWDLSRKYNKPLIPCFNSSDKQNVLVYVADTSASVTPKIDFFCWELTGAPF